MTTEPGSTAGVLSVVDRWVLHGGTVSVVSRTDETVTVALLRCDGGEIVETVCVSTATWETRPVD